MSEFWLSLIGDAEQTGDKTSQSLDRSLRQSEMRESETYWTLRSPDFAMPEVIQGSARANVPYWTPKFKASVNKGGVTATQIIAGPWTGCMSNAHSEFKVKISKESVLRITGVRPKPITKEQQTIILRVVEDKKIAGMWEVGKPPPFNIDNEFAYHMDKTMRKIDNARKKKEGISDTDYDLLTSAINACKLSAAKTLFFGEKAIYHWSNIGPIVGAACIQNILFLIKIREENGALLGFARPLLAEARNSKVAHYGFSFPLVRYDVYDRLISKETMEHYGETDKKIWQVAYQLFYEFITRIYMEAHPLMPWTPSEMLNLKAISKSTDEVLSGACCVPVSRIREFDIHNIDRVLALLQHLGVISMIQSKSGEHMVFVPSMRDAEQQLAEVIAILIERSYRGHVPLLNKHALETLKKTLEELEAEEDGEDVKPQLNAEQFEGVCKMLLSAVHIFTGGGGVGKSRTGNYLLDYILDLETTAACAPTCNATARVVGKREMNKGGRTAQYQRAVCDGWASNAETAEKADAMMEYGIYDEKLYWEDVEHCDWRREMFGESEAEYGHHFPMTEKHTLRRRGEGTFAFKNPHPLLKYRTLVFDEASMASTPLLRSAYHMAKFGLLDRILFICDPNQLPAIGPGRPLRTILEKNIRGCSITHLIKNHRVKEKNGSVVSNALLIAQGTTQGFKIDEYSRLLFRMNPSVIWLALQIYHAADKDLNSLQVITNRVSDASIFNSAFYLIFVWLKSGEPMSADMVIASQRIMQLGFYLSDKKLNPFDHGCIDCVRESVNAYFSQVPFDEIQMLKRLPIFISMGMRMAYTKNVQAAGISANRQMIVRRFLDVDARFVEDILEDPEATMECQPLGANLPHAKPRTEYDVLRHQDHIGVYDVSSFWSPAAYNEFMKSRSDPYYRRSPVVRCMVYTLHMPHDRGGESQHFWVPVGPSMLRLISSNTGLGYAKTVNGMQGCEERHVFYAFNFPTAIVAGEKTDNFIRRENVYTAVSRAQETITLIVDNKYAMNVGVMPSQGKSCLVTKVNNVYQVATADFFGLRNSISKRHPLPASLLPEFIEDATAFLKPSMDKLEENCICHRDKKFMLKLVELMCAKMPEIEAKREERDKQKLLGQIMTKVAKKVFKRDREKTKEENGNDEDLPDSPAVSKFCKKE